MRLYDGWILFFHQLRRLPYQVQIEDEQFSWNNSGGVYDEQTAWKEINEGENDWFMTATQINSTGTSDHFEYNLCWDHLLCYKKSGPSKGPLIDNLSKVGSRGF